MRRCSCCGISLTACNEGIDHISFEVVYLGRVVYICQSCLAAIYNQVEYGLSAEALAQVDLSSRYCGV